MQHEGHRRFTHFIDGDDPAGRHRRGARTCRPPGAHRRTPRRWLRTLGRQRGVVRISGNHSVGQPSDSTIRAAGRKAGRTPRATARGTQPGEKPRSCRASLPAPSEYAVLHRTERHGDGLAPRRAAGEVDTGQQHGRRHPNASPVRRVRCGGAHDAQPRFPSPSSSAPAARQTTSTPRGRRHMRRAARAAPIQHST